MTDWQLVSMAVAFLYATAGSIVMLLHMVITIIKIKFMEE